MNNFVTSLIRTYVPIAVGAFIAFLATRGVDIDPQAQAGLITFVTAVLQGVYYLVARLLEQKLPKLGGLLLGSSKAPEYTDKGL